MYIVMKNYQLKQYCNYSNRIYIYYYHYIIKNRILTTHLTIF